MATGGEFWWCTLGLALTPSQVLTGSYHNYFRIYDVNGDNDTVLQADKSAFKAKKIGGARNKTPGKKEAIQTEGIDFAKKIVSAGPGWGVRG